MSTLSGELTRQLITIVLERGQRFGLDMAGGFLGPAWPFVRPLVEQLLEGLPERIAGGWRNSEEKLQEALDEIEQRDDEIALIGEALAKNGIDADWANAVTVELSGISDDIFEVLCNQGAMIAELSDIKKGLETLLADARAFTEKQPANIEIRGSNLEFVDFLRVPDGFQSGYDLAPTDFALNSVGQPHMPAGFMVWQFSLFNVGQKKAVVGKIELVVDGEGDCPPESRYDELKPTLDPVDDRVELEMGAGAYPLFRGQRFGYAPDEDDAFRVQILFVRSGPPVFQRLRPIVHWSDSVGEHRTIGTEIFLASHPDPQIEQARLKFKLPDA